MMMAKRAGLCDGPIKLETLYELCFDSSVSDRLHQADVDARVCAEIYFYLTEQMETRFYKNVAYDDKDAFKQLGGLWDAEKKKWYVFPCNRFLRQINKWFK